MATRGLLMLSALMGFLSSAFANPALPADKETDAVEGLPHRGTHPRHPDSHGGARPGSYSGTNEKLLRLIEAPPERLDAMLDQWPKAKEMSPEDRNKLKERVLRARAMIERQALALAKRNAVRVPPERKDEFLSSYAKERREMEETLRQEFEPRRKQLELEMSTRLREKFGTAPTPSEDVEADDLPPTPEPKGEGHS